MLIERHVPPEKQEAEIADLLAVAQQIAIRGPRPGTVPAFRGQVGLFRVVLG
jgi:hypothetical protein